MNVAQVLSLLLDHWLVWLLGGVAIAAVLVWRRGQVSAVAVIAMLAAVVLIGTWLV